MKNHDDQPLDQVLLEFREKLNCDDVRRKQMHDRLFQQLADDQPQPRRHSRRQIAFALALCASVLMAFVWFNRPNDPTLVAIDGPSRPPRELLTFTKAEVRQHQSLVCELDRVFDNKVRLVHHRNQSLEFDLDDGATFVEQTPRVLLRFVLQRQTEDTDWQTVQTQELIGCDDHQFSLPEDAGFDIRYWSHLLPDRSLWAEFTLSTDSGVEQTSLHKLRAVVNEPLIVWTRANDAGTWRLWLVYELLNRCDGELI